MRKLLVLVVLVSMVLVALPASACCGGGTGTPGYWKNHPEAWPVSEIQICNETFTKDEAIAIMKTPGKGDKTYTLFNALVAAILNVENGAEASCIVGTIKDAGEWFCDHDVGDNVRGPNEWRWGEQKYLILDAYNNGYMCAPSRDSLE